MRQNNLHNHLLVLTYKNKAITFCTITHLSCIYSDDKEEEFEQWRKENAKFVTTTAVTAILDIIKEKSFTVLTGSQGIGKSAIAQHLCLLLKDTEKFIIITGLQPSEIIKSVKKDNNQIFLVDDL